eukprot:4970172-Prymnesium_polylepis.2
MHGKTAQRGESLDRERAEEARDRKQAKREPSKQIDDYNPYDTSRLRSDYDLREERLRDVSGDIGGYAGWASYTPKLHPDAAKQVATKEKPIVASDGSA